MRTGGARILIRNGRHPVRCGDEEGGEIELGCEGMALDITGQEGACLYGTCVLGRGGGCIEGVKIENVVMICLAESDGEPPVDVIMVMKKEDGGDAEELLQEATRWSVVA